MPLTLSDVAVKQMILAINEHMPCIIMDLDETHVLVNERMVDQLHVMLEAEVCVLRVYLTLVWKKHVYPRHVDVNWQMHYIYVLNPT